MGERGQSPQKSQPGGRGLQPGGQKFVSERHKLVNVLLGWRSPESLGIENRTQILSPLSWNEVRLLWVHYNTQLSTNRENSTESLENCLARVGLNKPVVEVPTHTNAETVENGRDRSHNLGEDLGSHGETEAESPKLVRFAEGHKQQVLATVRVDGDLQVRFLQIDEDHPVTLTD